MFNSKAVTHLLVQLLAICLCNAQLHYFRQPSTLYHRSQAAATHYQFETNALAPSSSSSSLETASLAHPSVVANSLRESELPSELLKSERFYKNPHIAAALAKESWFTDQEMPVIDREAEKIPREQVYKIFHNAGWIKRR